jgi:hypothetical protein
MSGLSHHDTSTRPYADADRLEKLRLCVTSALPAALRTGGWLLIITVPVSFAVLLMKQFGLLALIARFCEPLFLLFGLPGEAAIVFATSCLLNIYSCIAVIETLGLTGRTVTILALMCLISHNLIVECAVQKKAGTSAIRILIIRLASSFAGAWALGMLLPPDAVNASPSDAAALPEATVSLMQALQSWAVDISWLCGKILLLVTVLMILQRILEAFGIAALLARGMKVPLMLLGLSQNTAFLWIVANVIGLAYGAGIIIDTARRGQISRPHTHALNYHIAVSHSLLEDTCLFVAIGVSVWWITIPRVVLAGIAVWINRLIDAIRARLSVPREKTA